MLRRPVLALVPALTLLACADDPDRARALVSTWTPRERPTVDLLLVLDDSPSMRTFVSNGDFATNLDVFAQIIESPEYNADFRVAITTTGVPGPTCAGPFARGGELLTDTCLSLAPSAFVGPGELEQDVLDATASCTDACALASLDRRPSPVDEYQTDLAIRPWLEPDNNSYGGNLASGVSFEQALTCAGLRGFGGCEYESPLAAASRALEHMRTPGDPAFGFLREGVPLMILVISDEDDCSHPEGSATIFDPAGSDVFWTDPAGPSSGVCHRASTLCDAFGCEVVDRNLAGEVTEQFADAALTSLVQFQAELDTLRQERPVIVSLVGGVRSNGALRYDESDDLERIAEFGWGPGCDDAGDRVAQPPGRLHAQVSDGNAFSICDGAWWYAFDPVFANIPDGLRPWLAPLDTADAEPERPGLQPDCEIRVRTAVDELIPVPLCQRDSQGFVIDAQTQDYAPPDGADRCWAWRDDPGGVTESPYDDLSPETADGGFAAEFVLAARPGAAFLPRGSVYEAVCAPE